MSFHWLQRESVNKMNKRIYAGTTLMIIISSILIEIKSYNTVFIRIKIAIILLTFILIGIFSYIKLKSYKS